LIPQVLQQVQTIRRLQIGCQNRDAGGYRADFAVFSIHVLSGLIGISVRAGRLFACHDAAAPRSFRLAIGRGSNLDFNCDKTKESLFSNPREFAEMLTYWSKGSILAMAVVSIASTGAFAGNNQKAFSGYTEIPGVQEFTGRMVARPVQDAARNQTAADRLAPWAFEYVWQTDEHLFNVPEGMTENEVGALLLATGDYEYVEPDWFVYPTIRPNDTYYNSAWQHRSINSEAAWDLNTGDRDVWIGICDSGCDLDHEDLASNRISGYNSPTRTPEAQGGQVADINGHGSGTAGMAAAIGNNGRGTVGAGWDLSHMTIRVTNSSGGGAYMSDITTGARWAIENGCKVANASFSGVTSPSVQSTGYYIKNIGGLLTWSAGNDGRRIDSPDHADVIIVGATTSSNNRASFSNYGAFIDVMAPGSSVFSCTRYGSYTSMSGTSFSAPLVAGVCGLIWSADQSMEPETVEQILFDGCDSMGSTAYYGYGLVDSYDSLQMVDAFQLLVLPEPLFGGNVATVWALGGDPNTPTGAYYSLSGFGSTYISALGTWLEIKNAKPIGPIQNTDGNGDAFWQKRTPTVKKAKLAYVQVAQNTGRLTDVAIVQINP
jgi:subtilisin family serine protease